MSPCDAVQPSVMDLEEERLRAKRQKRAETRPCPVCAENIPIRLLGAHTELETRRVNDIISAIGSEHPIYDESEPGPSSRARKSANKARHSIATQSSKSLGETTKTLQSLQRRRRQRGLKLKEIANLAEDTPDTYQRRSRGERPTCPVCLQEVAGESGDVNAHIDTCLLLAASAEQAEAGSYTQDSESEGNYVGDLPGVSFSRRNQYDEDMEEDVDIDGDDEVKYGQAQFSETDILASQQGLVNLDPPNDGGTVALRGESVPELDDNIPNMRLVEGEIEKAMASGDTQGHITALQKKIRLLQSIPAESSALCRICLDPYNEPTISIGCFHTSCRECWLRCLGSTKLCPICKRITAAADLRRVYL